MPAAGQISQDDPALLADILPGQAGGQVDRAIAALASPDGRLQKTIEVGEGS